MVLTVLVVRYTHYQYLILDLHFNIVIITEGVEYVRTAM